MSNVVCPECGKVTTIESFQRAASEFCDHCDYPLFWAPSSVAAAVAVGDVDTTRRRLPGVAGRLSIGTQLCPACGELNPLAADVCVRCGADLRPVEPEPEPEWLPPPEPPAPPPPEPKPSWLWWLVAAALVAGGVTAAVLGIN